MQTNKVDKDLTIRTMDISYTIEDPEVEGDLIISAECVNLKELILTGMVHVGGNIVCKLPKGCNLMVTCNEYAVGGCIGSFKSIKIRQSQ